VRWEFVGWQLGVWQGTDMSPMIEPPNSLILIVGRDEFTPPTQITRPITTTLDCLVIGTINVQDAPTLISIGTDPDIDDLEYLDEISIESDGEISVRDIYNNVHASVTVQPGVISIAIWTSGIPEPREIACKILSAT
jgi:hypothetical protein